MVAGSKHCNKCNTTKAVTEFYRDKNGKDGINYCCKSCSNLASRRNHTLRNYGLTLAEYLAKLEAQDGKCAICTTPLKSSGTNTHLDHDHTTGNLREFLCSACNKGLGYFKDSITNLTLAIEYLIKHKPPAQ